MVDNTTLNAGSGGDSIATDDIGGIKHQRVKVEYGDNGSATDVSSANPLPVIVDGATALDVNISSPASLPVTAVISSPTTFPIAGADSPSIDAFARLRVSNPTTLFDSKQLFDKLPRRWDDQEVSGSGTTSTYNTNQASTTIAVGTAAGKRVRQTFMSFNYQPGKSQLIFMTTTVGAGGAGITRAVGQFNDSNGIFFRDNEGVLEACIRSNVTSTPVDTAVAQANWNVDKMDGTGASGININPALAQIIFFDYEWLGVGRVRMGFVINGIPTYCHEFLNTNTTLSTVYMSTPNLPLRYEIENDGTGAAAGLDHICCSVMSEGGHDELGVVHYHSTGNTHIDANTAGTLYAVVGMRLKATHIGSVVKELATSMLSKTSDDFEWVLMMNPTVAGTFTYSDHPDSSIQVATGATANTVTGGHETIGGFATNQASVQSNIPNAIYLGAAIDGTVDEVVLCVRPLGANADIVGGITWRELT